MLGEKASHLASSSAAQTLPFVPYHPEELRQRGHRRRPGTQRRCASTGDRFGGCAPYAGAIQAEGTRSAVPRQLVRHTALLLMCSGSMWDVLRCAQGEVGVCERRRRAGHGG